MAKKLRYFALTDELGWPIPSTMRGYTKDPCKCELVEIKGVPDQPLETDVRRYHPNGLHYFYQVNGPCCDVVPNSLIATRERPKGKYREFIHFDVVPLFTATRTQSFTRNNCPGGQQSLVAVPFSKEYVSTVSQADADTLASSDATFTTQGQAFANTNGVCTPV